MLPLLLLPAFAALSFAATVNYNFDVGWVSAAPDGFVRPVIGINGKWPIPTIEANLGDTVVVTVHNSLGNESTSLHFHGMYQKGTAAYDGTVGLTQCPIKPGDSYTYTFTAEPAGTHWYHSHDRGQYPDGLRGKMIIHDSAWESSLNVVQQLYLSMSDWYHTQFPFIIHDYLSPSNTAGDFPSPDSFLFNDTRTPVNFTFAAGKRYLLRIVNLGSLACGEFHIDGHTLSVVGVDGVHVQPQNTDSIILCAGQRYDVVVTGKSGALSSYNWIAKMTTDMLTRDIPPASAITVIGDVVYTLLGAVLNLLNGLLNPQWTPSVVLDDFTLKPLDGQALLTKPTNLIDLKVNQTYYSGIGTRIALGGQPWVEPKVPSLYTALSTGIYASNASTYGVGVDPWILNQNEVVQVYLVNNQVYPHPMHLHGHEFQLVARGTGTWNGNEASLPKVPMKRDVVVVPANGYIVLRFTADNPGVWFFHCHIDLHLTGGMASTFIEAPTALQKSQSIPAAGTQLCSDDGECTSGNCACASGAISASDSQSKCNTIFNANPENYGALVNAPSSRKRLLRA